MKEINTIKPQEPKPRKRKVLVPSVTSSPSSGKRGRPIDWQKRLAKEKEKERLKAERKQAREDSKLFKKLERDRIKAERKAERERLKKAREEQRKQEKEDFKEYVKGANEQLKKLKEELGMDERDIKVALGSITGLKLTNKGKISVNSARKNRMLMKQAINSTLDSKESLLKSYEHSGYGEFKRWADLKYDIDALKSIIDLGTLPTEYLVQIDSESNWEEIKNAFNSFDDAILKENIQEGRAQLMNIHQMLDDFDDWAKENHIIINYEHHRNDIDKYYK